MIEKPPTTRVKGIPSGNYGSKRSLDSITQVTFHHIVGDAASAIGEMQRPGREMTSNFIIGSDGTIYEIVPINTVAYCDGNSASNKRTVSIEHAGGHPNVPYTSAMYDSSILLNAWLISTLGINSFKRHSEVSNNPTACPGKLDVEYIVSNAFKLAQENGMALADKTLLTKLWVGYAVQYPAPESYLNHWDGKPVTEVLDWLEVQPIHIELLKKAAGYEPLIDKVNALEKELANKPTNPTPLKPGVYKVGE